MQCRFAVNFGTLSTIKNKDMSIRLGFILSVAVTIVHFVCLAVHELICNI